MITNKPLTIYHVQQAQDGTVTATRFSVPRCYWFGSPGTIGKHGLEESCSFVCRIPPGGYVPPREWDAAHPAAGWTIAPGDIMIPATISKEIGESFTIEDAQQLEDACSVRWAHDRRIGGAPHIYVGGV